MKKQYINPSTILLEIGQHNDILAGSNISMGVQKEDFDSESMNSLSRRGNSIWDDEE
ncbi:MAG: hypothetical protein IJ533_06955 [Prevotella sp.]|nr:hypothetical protein [Prevotella sp.]